MKYIHAERFGKLFEQFKQFIQVIEQGKRAIMFSPLYVVMDQKSYQDLIGNKPGTAKEPDVIELKSGKDYWYEKRIG